MPLSGPSEPKKRKLNRGYKEVLTPKLLSFLDRCKISNRDAAKIVIAVIEALGHNANEYIINEKTILNRRKEFRQEEHGFMKESLKNADLQGAVVHWDGKILPAVSGKGSVDRIAVIVTAMDFEQIIGVPKVEAGTGEEQANAVIDALNDWDLTDKIQAISFDTTASNTGRLKGACVLLEQKIGRDLLYLACRHHIMEIILKAVFDLKMGGTTCTGPPIFKRFQDQWEKIHKEKFLPGTKDTKLRKILKNESDKVKEFCVFQLTSLDCQPREDYKELLELVLIFLGEIPPNGLSIRMPGAIHHARWMAKAIYCLKIFIFRQQFKMEQKEKEALMELSVFIILIYVKAWILAPIAPSAPNNDLKLLSKLSGYKTIDQDISQIALQKFMNHLWYFSSEAVGLAFFDVNIPIEEKEKMVASLSEKELEHEKKYRMRMDELPNVLKSGLHQFVNEGTRRFFSRFKIQDEFLQKNPKDWPDNEIFQKGLKIVQSIKVVNDSAERGVKLISDYNKILSKDEEQKQFLMTVVAENRKLFPDSKKKTLLQ